MKTVTIYDYTGEIGEDEAKPDEILLVVPAKRRVCVRCDGEGVHDPEAFSQGFTREDFDRDPDFEKDYHAGLFNVPCSVCGGKRVQDVADWDEMTERQRELAAAYDEEQAQYAAEVEMERRMGY